MKALFTLLCLLLAAAAPQSSHRLAASMERKLDFLQRNAQLRQPSQAPTVMTEEEINDYFAAGRVNLPLGIKKVAFQGYSGVVTTFATVDFDQIRAGRQSSNPLLSIFSGTHLVRIESDASGSGGQGRVHIRGVSLDGTEIPRMALQFFVDRYIKPKYPNLGLDSQFQMPYKIDIARVGYHKLTVTQK